MLGIFHNKLLQWVIAALLACFELAIGTAKANAAIEVSQDVVSPASKTLGNSLEGDALAEQFASRADDAVADEPRLESRDSFGGLRQGTQLSQPSPSTLRPENSAASEVTASPLLVALAEEDAAAEAQQTTFLDLAFTAAQSQQQLAEPLGDGDHSLDFREEREEEELQAIAPADAIAASEDSRLVPEVAGQRSPAFTPFARQPEGGALAMARVQRDEAAEVSGRSRLLARLWADDNEEPGRSAGQKAPWLARQSAAEDDTSSAQSDSTEQSSRLALNASQRQAAKRPAAWISLTPQDLLEAEDGDLAIRESTPSAPSEVYDVSDLQQVAITPADLAEANEVAVSVDASQVEFLTPAAGAFLDVPATSVVLRFPVGANIALLVNGQIVDASLVGRTETNTETQLRTQSWYGIPLVAGENRLEVISTETGEVLRSLPLSVRGQPARLVLLSPRAIAADGRSTASVRGQLVDEFGNLSRWDSMVTLRASDGQFLGADQKPDQPGFQVEIVRGEFVAQLQSSLEAHLVQLEASANSFEAFGQVQFETPRRPSLVSGVVDLRLGARGTDYYSSYREFLPVDGDHAYGFDVDAAVFATGNLGEWLYTGAYNSDRSLNETCQGERTLFRAAADGDCSGYVTYGDDSTSEAVAPSLDSLYLRFERNSPSNELAVDYGLWGDYGTEEFATASQVFSATNRQLHGFKAHYNFGNLALTGLYGNNVEGFARDTIAPDGTSGFYFTSQRNLVPGSETVYLEVEELERPGTVLSRELLSRGADYEIDYDRGTLRFSEPVTRTEVDRFGQLLVRRIVATYQHEDGSDTDILAGRAQYTLNQTRGQESWLGASYFEENQGSRDFSLYGVDARLALGESAQVVGEIAHSASRFDLADTASDSRSGSAYRLEVDGDLGNWLTGRAYFRSTDEGFSNAATTSFVPGQTRYGGDLTGNLGGHNGGTSLRARFDHEDNFGSAPPVITDFSGLFAGETLPTLPGRELDNSLTTYSLGVTQRIGRGTAEVDWIHRDRTDRLTPEASVSSDQLRSRFSTPLTNTLTVVAQNELNLSSEVDPIYPSRTLIGLNWQAMPGLNVGLNQIFYSGGGNDRGSVTSLDVTGEHTFASDTTVRGRFSSVDGRQIGGVIGLEQGINLAPGLDLDLGYEKVFSTFGNQTAASTQFSQPFATGSNAAALGLAGGESYHVGLAYTDNPDFQASGRFEHRRSGQSSNTVFNISALGRITPELTLVGDYRLARSANQGIEDLGTTSLLKLGMAYRNPADDRWNALLRYEYRLNPNALPTDALGTSTDTQEHLLAAEAIYAPNWRWEFYGKYALRNSRTELNGASGRFASSSTTQLAQARATYRLGYRWDVVGEARWLGGNGYSETGFSVEGGYYPLPDLRLSAGYSHGATDYDFGEGRDAGGFYMGVTAKLSGLLNGFGRGLGRGLGSQPNDPAQQQESRLEAASTDALTGESMPLAAPGASVLPAVEVQKGQSPRPAAEFPEAQSL